ncbi:hypothetical protein HMI55_004161 [Coelomomyces lativittatus]|nr:hypothetical protein HMI55_004161 [Coelomomyces lativittatus]
MTLVFSSQSYQSHRLEMVKKEQHCAFRWMLIEKNQEDGGGSTLNPLESDISIEHGAKQYVKLQLKFNSIMECTVFYNTIQETLHPPLSSPLTNAISMISSQPLECSAPPPTAVSASQCPSSMKVNEDAILTILTSLLTTSDWKHQLQQCLEHDSFFKLVETLESFLQTSFTSPPPPTHPLE